jgi:protein-disulfide isomerase
MKKSILLGLSIFAYSLAIFHPSYAGVEWTPRKELSIGVVPLDIALTPDGQWLFVLASGEVLIYSTVDGGIINRIPVDTAFDKISFSPVDNTLVVAGGSGKSVKLIQVEKVYKFSISRLPFRGAENAPVTITVFSDYQ